MNMPTYTDLMTQTDADGQAHSYLANDRNYAVVRALQGRNLVIPVVGDFAGPKAIREVGHYLASHDTTVTAFYLSNVERYLFERRGPGAASTRMSPSSPTPTRACSSEPS